jgi:hypothetical protein
MATNINIQNFEKYLKGRASIADNKIVNKRKQTFAVSKKLLSSPIPSHGTNLWIDTN